MVLRRQEDFAKEPRHIRHSSRRLRSGLPTVQGLRSAGVRFGYSDGYYDNERRWHDWRSDDERNFVWKHRFSLCRQID